MFTFKKSKLKNTNTNKFINIIVWKIPNTNKSINIFYNNIKKIKSQKYTTLFYRNQTFHQKNIYFEKAFKILLKTLLF